MTPMTYDIVAIELRARKLRAEAARAFFANLFSKRRAAPANAVSA